MPHEAAAELEMRALDPAVLREAGAALEALAVKTPPADGAEISVECLGCSPAWAQDERNHRLFSLWESSANQFGIAVQPVSRGGLSDANYLCHLGPTLDGLGPAGGNAHCSERSADGSKVPEYVELDSFVPKAALNVAALISLLGSAEKSA